MSDTADKCQKCEHYTPTALFELCEHAASKYKIGVKEDWHTVGHMRGPRGSCGINANLFKEKV